MRGALVGCLLTCGACGSFDAAPVDDAASPAVDAGSDAPAPRPPNDAAIDGDAARACTVVVVEPFDTIAVDGWSQPRQTGTASLGIAKATVGGNSGLALFADTVVNAGSAFAARAYLERVAPHARTTSAVLDYELAVASRDPNAFIGCLLGARQGLVYEPQIDLAMTADGPRVVGSLQTQTASLPMGDAKVAADAPADQTWVPMHSELALVGRTVERSTTIGGRRYDLPAFDLPPDAAASFDGIHVSCGIRDAFAPPASGASAHARVLIRNVKVTGCTPNG